MDGFMLTQQYSAISVMKISYLYSSVIVSALCILNVGVLPQTLMTVKINGVIFFFFFICGGTCSGNHTGLECPQDLSSSFTPQERNEVCLFSLFLRLEQTYLLHFHPCFWLLTLKCCWCNAVFWILPPYLDLCTQAGFESILANSSAEGLEGGKAKGILIFVL